jgi:oxygen-dependent protoporphyrinogen oxidase
MKRIAIVGGGIAGLSAAFYLQQARERGAQLEYRLFERAPRLGGVMITDRADGCLVEAGPDSFISEKPWAAQLCRDLGIDSQLLGSNDEARKTFILVRGRLVPLPDGLMFLIPTKLLPTLLSPLFSLGTKLRMAREFLFPPAPCSEDESVAAFVSRHFGPEMVERLADPLLSGVYGGTAEALSVRAVLPRFVEMEKNYRSLGRASIGLRKKMAAWRNSSPTPKSIFTSLENGMQQLVDAVAARLDRDSVLTSAAIHEVRPDQGRWAVLRDDGSRFDCDAVILALPAYASADLLRSASAPLAAELDQIAYTSSVTVALACDMKQVSVPLEGFGFLVPRAEGKRVLACTFVHNKFPHRAPADRALLRVFLGGASAETALSQSDDEIVAIVRRELQEILGLAAAPLFTRVYRWRRSMAQYGPGHLERMERIEALRRGLPGLHLIGNAYRGIGVPDCVRMGMDAAADLTR